MNSLLKIAVLDSMIPNALDIEIENDILKELSSFENVFFNASFGVLFA